MKLMGSRAFKEDVDKEGKRLKAQKEREKREKREEGALGGGRKKGVVAGIRYGDVLEATQDRKSTFSFLYFSFIIYRDEGHRA